MMNRVRRLDINSLAWGHVGSFGHLSAENISLLETADQRHFDLFVVAFLKVIVACKYCPWL